MGVPPFGMNLRDAKQDYQPHCHILDLPEELLFQV
jgi:hypothetical protein